MVVQRVCAVLAIAAACFASGGAFGQEKFEFKFATFTGDFHAVQAWLNRWCESMEQQSNGRLVIKRFTGSQMGPAQNHYDFARTGQADFTWFLHGGTPGRFPLTELINLPLLIGSAEIGAKVLNDPELRTKYLDAEHKGVKLLFLMTHQPGQLHTVKKPVRTIDDMKGLRVRFASPAVRDFITALGGTAVGVPPPEMAEQLSKGTVDGAFTDYGGAGIAWKLGGIVKHTTELYGFVTSFGIAMNPDSYNKLPPDLQKLFTLVGREAEQGKIWDDLDGPGKKALIDGGMHPIKLSPEDSARMKKVAAELAESTVKQLEAKSLPARATYNLMKSLAEKHAKTSRNFLE